MDVKLPIHFSGEDVSRSNPPMRYGSIADTSNSDSPNILERRSSMRFQLELDADVSTAEQRFRGRTVNISSGGLLMNCGGHGEVGSLVTIRLDWPIQQRNKRITLVVHGEIIRRETDRFAVRQQRHEFEVSSLPSISHASAFSLNHKRGFVAPLLEMLQSTCRWVGQSINCPPLTSSVSPTT